MMQVIGLHDEEVEGGVHPAAQDSYVANLHQVRDADIGPVLGDLFR